MCDQGVVDRAAYEAQNRVYYEQYVGGTLDIHEYLGFALRPLAAHSPEDLARWHAEFMESRIRPMILPAARVLVRRHLEAGELCAIITATNSFVTAPIAREFGVEHLIATEPERRNGRFTGRVAGTPCFRAASSCASTNGSPAADGASPTSRRAPATATRTTTCRCSNASRARWRSIPTRRSPARPRAAAGSASRPHLLP